MQSVNNSSALVVRSPLEDRPLNVFPVSIRMLRVYTEMKGFSVSRGLSMREAFIQRDPPAIREMIFRTEQSIQAAEAVKQIERGIFSNPDFINDMIQLDKLILKGDVEYTMPESFVEDYWRIVEASEQGSEIHKAVMRVWQGFVISLGIEMSEMLAKPDSIFMNPTRASVQLFTFYVSEALERSSTGALAISPLLYTQETGWIVHQYACFQLNCIGRCVIKGQLLGILLTTLQIAENLEDKKTIQYIKRKLYRLTPYETLINQHFWDGPVSILQMVEKVKMRKGLLEEYFSLSMSPEGGVTESPSPETNQGD